MRSVLLAFCLLVSLPALAVQAQWTGVQRQVQTVTYQWVWECEYNLDGRKFTRLFRSNCPPYIDVL